MSAEPPADAHGEHAVPAAPAVPEVVARTMTPFGDMVVLEMLPDDTAHLRIILPEGARVNYARAKRAIVVDCGPKARAAGLEPGAEVLVAPFVDGVDITVPGTGAGAGRFRLTGAAAVVAVLSEERPIEALEADVLRLMDAIYARDRLQAMQLTIRLGEQVVQNLEEIVLERIVQ